MVNIRSANEIILSLRDFFKIAQPDANFNPGSVIRDLLEGPASQLAILYDQLSGISNKQSLRLVVGSDLDKLAKNFGLVRKSSTPSSGVALMTFSSLNANININKGDIVTANNGFTFQVSNGVTVTATSSNFYKSIAAKYSDQLSFVNISDQYAVEVTVSATTAGTAGNIPSYSLNRASTSGVSNVTNVSAFNGGTDQESDASFRSRILSAFSGSSIGTALGYLNTALSVTGVSDAYVVEPGDSLMTRDGSIVSVAVDGTRTIVSEGSGGKVDVIVLGNNLIENTESYIYLDKSNANDPTSSKNDVTLGQISGDLGKTINKKRIDNIKNGQLPAQPVETILEISGSLSGANFKEKTVDSLGRVSGNYELVKDTGAYSGSPWGMDKLHWISDRVSDYSEDKIKGQFNGQDAASFSDVTDISSVIQTISIINENSNKTSDKSIIQLLHTPVANVTKVVNVNTGERYLITDQNLDSTGIYNTTGRIKISGNTLPVASDVLQVDYSWVVEYDSTMDYDGLKNTNNPRAVTDSIDWGYSSVVTNELINFTKSGDYYIGTAKHPISSVISASKFTEILSIASKITSGPSTNRISVTVNNLTTSPSTINSIKLKNSNIEVYNTAENNGTFITTSAIVGIDVVYNVTITLPTDTLASDGDYVSVFIDYTEVFISGSSNGNQITIPSASVSSTSTNINLLVTYLSFITDFVSTTISNIPMSRSGNGYLLSNNNGFTNSSITNISKKENVIIQKNLSNQYYVDISLPATDSTILNTDVISVVRLSDGLELWNSDNLGTIATSNSGNYQAILSGYNTPAVGDRAIIFYYSYDNRRFQPFTYDNKIIKSFTTSLSTDPVTGKLFIKPNDFSSQLSGLTYEIIEPNTSAVLFTASDGVLTVSGDEATITSASLASYTDPAIANKKIKITNATNIKNNGLYDIISYDDIGYSVVIKNIYNYLLSDQVSIIRLVDGKEIWSSSGTIDSINNKLLLPNSTQAFSGDYVYVILFNYKNLRNSSSKVISTTVDQAVNSGVLTISGTSMSKAKDIIFTATNSGLKLNISEAIRKTLGLSSVTSIPSTIKIAKIVSLEKVVTAGSNNDEVLEISSTFDVKLSSIQNNLLFSDDMSSNSALTALDFVLPSTSNNLSNLPKIGDKLRITFYYTVDNDSENLSFTKNGTLYTNKKFALINRVYVSSGFKSSLSTKITLTSFAQPIIGSRYKVYYDYMAPKQNERISIKTNYNKIISDTTFAIESSRPINADVLVKSATLTLLNVSVNIVISSDYSNTSSSVVQNVKDQIITAMTTTELGQTIDMPTLVNAAQSVPGVSRARVTSFYKNGTTSQLLTFKAQNNEYFAPNEVIVNTETR